MDRLLQERAFTRDLLRVSRTYRREVDRALVPHNISEARALPVVFISRLGEGVRQGVLAEALGIEGPSLVRLIDQLCSAGLVERRDDPDDRRAKALHLTDAGRNLVQVIGPTGDGVRTMLLSDVSDDDLAAALRVLTAFQRKMKAANAQTRHAEA